MSSCAVARCQNKKRDRGKDDPNAISFHKFPKTASIRNAWIAQCGRSEKFNVDSAHICSEHFTKDDYEGGGLRSELMSDVTFKRILKRTAIPRIGCGVSPDNKMRKMNSPDPPEDSIEEDDLLSEYKDASPETLSKELNIANKKLRNLILEYEILKEKSQEQETKIKELQKENSLLKKKLFSKQT